MICKKCGRKFDDDMPKCLWCDAPNPKYETPDAEPESTPEKPKASEPPAKSEKPKHSEKRHGHSHKHATQPLNPKRESGTQVFWLCFLFGSLGAHCFWTKRRARGVQYLLWGGLIFALAYTAFIANESTIPAWFIVLSLASICVVKLLVLKDMWKICLGKYRSRKTGHRYYAASWMIPFAVIATAVTAFAIYLCSIIVVDNVLKGGRQIASKMELEVEAYMIAQQNYFEKNGKTGNLKEIGFRSADTKSPYFAYESAGNSLKVVYLANMNCPTNSTWIVEPSVLDSTLLWKVTLPEDLSCNAMAPQIKKLKERIEKPLEPAASTPKLDEGVDGVGVVPDTTQHRDSL